MEGSCCAGSFVLFFPLLSSPQQGSFVNKTYLERCERRERREMCSGENTNFSKAEIRMQRNTEASRGVVCSKNTGLKSKPIMVFSEIFKE